MCTFINARAVLREIYIYIAFDFPGLCDPLDEKKLSGRFIQSLLLSFRNSLADLTFGVFALKGKKKKRMIILSSLGTAPHRDFLSEQYISRSLAPDTLSHSIFLLSLSLFVPLCLPPRAILTFFICALLALLIETFRLARTLMNRIRPGWGGPRELYGVSERTMVAIRVAGLYPGAIAPAAALSVLTDDGAPLFSIRLSSKRKEVSLSSK